MNRDVIISTDNCPYNFKIKDKNIDLLELYCILNRDVYYGINDSKSAYFDNFINMNERKFKCVTEDYFINTMLKPASDHTIQDGFKWNKIGKRIVKAIIAEYSNVLFKRID